MLVSLGASELTIAFTAAMAMLPAVVLAPVIGLIIDKVPFKKLMAVLLAIELVVVLGFIFIDSLAYVWVLMILIFIRSSASSMLFSAEMALFPKLVSREMLKNTNEIHSVIWFLVPIRPESVKELAFLLESEASAPKFAIQKCQNDINMHYRHHLAGLKSPIPKQQEVFSQSRPQWERGKG